MSVCPSSALLFLLANENASQFTAAQNSETQKELKSFLAIAKAPEQFPRPRKGNLTIQSYHSWYETHLTLDACQLLVASISHSDLIYLENQNGELRFKSGTRCARNNDLYFLFTGKIGGQYLRKPGPSGAKARPPSIGSKIPTPRGGPNKSTGKTYSKR